MTKEYVGITKIYQTATPNVKRDETIFCKEISFYQHKFTGRAQEALNLQLFLHTVCTVGSCEKLLLITLAFIQRYAYV